MSVSVDIVVESSGNTGDRIFLSRHIIVGRQGGKAKLVCSLDNGILGVPQVLTLEACPHIFGTVVGVNIVEQGVPFVGGGYMEPCRADALMDFLDCSFRSLGRVVGGGDVHGGGPGVKTSECLAEVGGIKVAVGLSCQVWRGFLVVVVHALGHPGLVADPYRAVNLVVAFIQKLPVLDGGIQVGGGHAVVLVAVINHIGNLVGHDQRVYTVDGILEEDGVPDHDGIYMVQDHRIQGSDGVLGEDRVLEEDGIDGVDCVLGEQGVLRINSVAGASHTLPFLSVAEEGLAGVFHEHHGSGIV